MRVPEPELWEIVLENSTVGIMEAQYSVSTLRVSKLVVQVLLSTIETCFPNAKSRHFPIQELIDASSR